MPKGCQREPRKIDGGIQTEFKVGAKGVKGNPQGVPRKSKGSPKAVQRESKEEGGSKRGVQRDSKGARESLQAVQGSPSGVPKPDSGAHQIDS